MGSSSSRPHYLVSSSIRLRPRPSPRLRLLPTRLPGRRRHLSRRLFFTLLISSTLFFLIRDFGNHPRWYHQRLLFTGSRLPLCRIGRQLDETPISAHHIYAPDGLVHVDVDGIHPILDLIKRAENEWDQKHDRASRTLQDAVREYKRRYQRDPPLGFDQWWDFTREMQVQLPDEYDSIHTHLLPFWGISPADLSHLLSLASALPDTYTLAKNETHDTHLFMTSFSDPEHWEQKNLLRGMKEIIALLDPVEPVLPPFKATISPHSTPSLLSDWMVMKACIDASVSGTYVDISRLLKHQQSGSSKDFSSACPPGSLTRSSKTRKHKTFIYNHRLSMDPCLHPHLLQQHTQYLSSSIQHSSTSPLLPLFSFSTTPLFSDIVLPFITSSHTDQVDEDDTSMTIPWQNKTSSRLFWRGTNAGLTHTPNTEPLWRASQLTRLVTLANDIHGTTTVLLPGPTIDEGWERVGHGTDLRKALLAPTLLDIAFAGKPVGCDVQYCRHLETLFEWREGGPQNEAPMGAYKYILDIDSKGPSSNFRPLLLTSSLIFKSTAFPEWYLDRSQPWVHYVPVQLDLSDLYDSILFFHGGLYAEDAHDDAARRIAQQGMAWAREYWREEDVAVYLFRLLLEYARVMSPDREAMSYKG